MGRHQRPIRLFFRPMIDSNKTIDPRPFCWVLAIAVCLIAIWLCFRFFGEQRYYNTAWWQTFRPVVLASQRQTARPVEVRDDWRNALTVVQTEKGLYFLSGTRYVPEAGSQMIVQANDHWELYLCAADGDRCMTIHSFCAGAVWPDVKRDATGRVEGCHAPYTGRNTSPRQPLKEFPPPGPGKRPKRMDPPSGMSHPREWASSMGLPVPAQ